MTTVFKGQAPPLLGREEFHIEFRKSFIDPAFESVSVQLSKEQSQDKLPRIWTQIVCTIFPTNLLAPSSNVRFLPSRNVRW